MRRESRNFQFFVGVEASATWHPGLSQWRPLFVDSQRLIARSQNRTKCVKYVWLSYPTWPSRWVLGISMQWLRLKGCHVACDEWTSGEICSLQHMWVTGSVMWAAASDESLKFGVQGATATNWFPRVNGERDNGIWLYEIALSFTMLSVNSINLWQIGGWKWGCRPFSFLFRAIEFGGLRLNSTTSIKIAPLLLADTLLQLVFLLQC